MTRILRNWLQRRRNRRDLIVTFDPARKVTARMLELERAGWVEQGPDGALWRLTDAGREVLKAAS